MARGMVGAKGPTKVPSPESGMRSDFVLGSRPAVLRAPSLGRQPQIKPQAANTRDYGKGGPSSGPFGTLGQGDTGLGGLS